MVPDVSIGRSDIKDLSDVIAPLAAKYHITAVYLFGSRARDDFKDDSDYDFIIDVSSEYNWDDHMDFMTEASKALERDVDVITRRSLGGDAFSVRVQKEMIHVC
ncbi:MAG: nucleotidyltransferase domain-containing protein [Candidatus Methanomethylophilaceae archaeon]|nr:nucleotidyltransferase domain-containing protein [Candidatus Methanomethylophilaceae archaeon]